MSNDYAYHGYMIRRNIVGDIWIEKDRHLIAWAKSDADAKQQIDALLSTQEGGR